MQKATHRGGLVRSREVEILRDTALKPTHTHTQQQDEQTSERREDERVTLENKHGAWRYEDGDREGLEREGKRRRRRRRRRPGMEMKDK